MLSSARYDHRKRMKKTKSPDSTPNDPIADSHAKLKALQLQYDQQETMLRLAYHDVRKMGRLLEDNGISYSEADRPKG